VPGDGRSPAACDDREVAEGAGERREAIRQLAGLRRRQAAAEQALTDALAAMKQAEGAFDAARDRFGAAERALDAAREDPAQARRERYAARQAYERASTTANRLARRVREVAERLDGMAG
jgi:chromosome segregation ATPase